MALTKEQAALIAKQNPELVKRLGLTGPALIARIMAEADLQGVTGEPMATPAVAVSPASPAPMQPGVEIVAAPVVTPEVVVAPASTGYMTPERLAANAAKARAAALGPLPENATYAEKAMRLALTGGAAEAENIAGLREQAQLPPEVKAALESARGRLAEQEAEVGADRKQAIWNALMNAGLSMAQSKSPYFGSALAEGLQTGLKGYTAEKASLAEKKARLGERKDDLTLKEYDMLQKARDAATDAYYAGDKRAGERMALANEALNTIANGETIDAKIKSELLAPKKIEADINYTEARTATEGAQQRLYGAQAEYYGRSPGAGMGGSSGALTPAKLVTIRNSLLAQRKQAEAAANILTNTDEKSRTAARAKIAQIDAQLGEIDKQIGIGGGGAATPSLAAAYNWTPQGLTPAQ